MQLQPTLETSKNTHWVKVNSIWKSKILVQQWP